LLISSDTVDFLLPIFYPHQEITNSVIIAGASRIAFELAERLEGRVEHLTVIDPDEEQAKEAAGTFRKAMVLNGDPTDLTVLEEASIDRCDLFCALSEDAQKNVMASLLAKKHGAKHTVVLTHEPEYAPILDSLGVDIIINPRLVVVGEILQHVRRGHIFSVTRPAEGEGEVIEMEAPPNCAAVESPLKKLRFPDNALVGAIVTNGDMRIPSGETQIEPGDRVLVYALPSAIKRIEKLFEERT